MIRSMKRRRLKNCIVNRDPIKAMEVSNDYSVLAVVRGSTLTIDKWYVHFPITYEPLLAFSPDSRYLAYVDSDYDESAFSVNIVRRQWQEPVSISIPNVRDITSILFPSPKRIICATKEEIIHIEVSHRPTIAARILKRLNAVPFSRRVLRSTYPYGPARSFLSCNVNKISVHRYSGEYKTVHEIGERDSYSALDLFYDYAKRQIRMVCKDYSRKFSWDGQTIQTQSECLRSARFSRDGSILFTGDADGSVSVRNGETFEEIDCLEGSSCPVTHLAFNYAGATLIAEGQGDKTTRIWDLSGLLPECRPVPTNHNTPDKRFLDL